MIPNKDIDSACTYVLFFPVYPESDPRLLALSRELFTLLAPFTLSPEGSCEGSLDQRFRPGRKGPFPHHYQYPVSLLDATLARSFVSVENKRLTENLSSLVATLTKNRGVGDVIVN